MTNPWTFVTSPVSRINPLAFYTRCSARKRSTRSTVMVDPWRFWILSMTTKGPGTRSTQYQKTLEFRRSKSSFTRMFSLNKVLLLGQKMELWVQCIQNLTDTTCWAILWSMVVFLHDLVSISRHQRVFWLTSILKHCNSFSSISRHPHSLHMFMLGCFFACRCAPLAPFPRHVARRVKTSIWEALKPSHR